MDKKKQPERGLESDLPSSSEELTSNSSLKKDLTEENRREADLEDKRPAGDAGPEDSSESGVDSQ